MASLGIAADDVRPADIDETPKPGERPAAYCRRIAAAKAAAVEVGADEVLLCADTTVALGRRILGKPADRDEARVFLNALSGRRHRVITALAVRRGDKSWHRTVETAVRFKQLSADEVEGYLDTGDWDGKAGAYAIQGPAAAFVPWLSGSWSAVVGLPLAETANLLQAAGVPLWSK